MPYSIRLSIRLVMILGDARAEASEEQFANEGAGEHGYKVSNVHGHDSQHAITINNSQAQLLGN